VGGEKMVIQFNNMALEVINFFQDEDGGYITINSKVSEEDFEKIVHMKFNLNNSYIPVKLNENDLLMRFGAVSFSKHEDTVKIQVSFVNKEYEGTYKETEKYALDEKKYTVERYVTELRLVNEKLMNLLMEKGILTATEKEIIQTITEKERFRKAIEFFEVDDIDDYEL
jgi:hypothetical protein